MKYRLADLLPLAWRQAMVDAGPYDFIDPVTLQMTDGSHTVISPRNEAGYCPLGALGAAGLVSYPEQPRHPNSPTAAAALQAALGLPYEECAQAAGDFINAWDYGEISDLAVALGLRVPRPVEDA
jgi:hypothetical protein